MYSFTLKTNLFELQFLNWYLDYPGRLAGKISIITKEVNFSPDCDFSPSQFVGFDLNKKELVLDGWGFKLSFIEEKDSVKFLVDFDTSSHPLSKNGIRVDSFKFYLETTCSFDDLEKLKEELKYFQEWVKLELDKK